MYKVSRYLNRVSVKRCHYSTNIKQEAPSVPTYFHNEANLPEKLNQTDNKSVKIQAVHDAVKQTTGMESKIVNNNSSAVPPRPLFSVGDVAGATSKNTHNYFSSYKEFCKGMAYLGVGIGVTFFLFDQHERLDESERKMEMMKKKQKEVVVQMQSYKNKLNKIAIDNAKKNVVLQGKMQMHIALLRKQLIELGVEPVDIEKAIQQFEEDVKVDIAANTVELWVPGESDVKRLIPDPHEYSQRR
jgi:hypothetical protein